MIDPKYIELINRDLDGELTERERRALEAYLASNPEARTYSDEIHKLSEMLDKVERLEPHPNLKKKILNSVSTKRVERREKSWNWLPQFHLRLNFRLVFSFAAGVVAGLFLFAIINPLQPVKQVDLVGTIGLEQTAGAMRVMDRSEIRQGDLRATLSTLVNGKLALVEMQLNTSVASDVVVTFEPSKLAPHGLTHVQRFEGPVQFGTGVVRFQHRGGNRYRLWFKVESPEESRVRVSMTTSGEHLERELVVLSENQ